MGFWAVVFDPGSTAQPDAGRRLLDVFTLHCYPQENNVGSDAVDSATELLRNESTRVFWDTNYTDPSWIANIIALIPRMKNWVATNYPGTKIGITEYNWGAEPYINGATAQADIDGIFGREGLDLATRWTTPDPSTPTYLAMKMYRNYDGNKSTFGDTSILTTVPDPDNLSAFARRADQRRRDDAHGHQQGPQQCNAVKGGHHQFRQQRDCAGLAAHRQQCYHPPRGCSLCQWDPQQHVASAEHHLVRSADGKKSPVAGWHQRRAPPDGIMDGWTGRTALHPSVVHQSDGLVGGEHQHICEQLLPVPHGYNQPDEPVLSRPFEFTVAEIISAKPIASSFDEPTGMFYRLAMWSIQAG